jgi:tetratricopeptide (TPR) repeat protein
VNTQLQKIRHYGWQLFAILLYVAWVYAPAMTGDFIWDDRTYIINNSLIRSPDGLTQIWSTNKMSDFWPLSYSLYWAMFRLFGTSSFGYHVVGVTLHLLNVILLWRLLHHLKIRFAFVAALLFAIHPICVESVAWIIEAKTTLAGCLALGCALLYASSRGMRDWRYWISLILYLLAMLAKAAVAPWPGVLLLIRCWQTNTPRPPKSDVISIFPFVCISLIITGFNVYWYAQKVDFEVASEVIRDDGILSRLAIGGKAFWFYIGKALAPTHLSFIYPRWPIYDPPSLVHLLPFATLVASFAGALYVATKRSRSMGASLVFSYVFLMTAPVLGLYDIYQMRYTFVTDHWFYYGLMGVMAAVASILDKISSKWRSIGVPATMAVMIIFGWLAHGHAKDFQDEETIWRATLKENPDSWMVHKTFGLVLKLKGRLDEAEAEYRKALRLKPQAETFYNLAIILESRNELQEALALYIEATKLNPYHWAIYNNLGSVQVRLGRMDDAIASFEKGLSFHPSYVTHYNIGLLLEERGDKKRSQEHFLAAQGLAMTDTERLNIEKKLNNFSTTKSHE